MMKHSTSGILGFTLWLLLSNAQAYTLEGGGIKWGDPTLGTGASISWSLIDATVDCSLSLGTDCEQTTVKPLSAYLATGFENEIRRAFDTWASVADLTFTEITDGGGIFGEDFVADIRFGSMLIDGAGDTNGNVLGYAYYPYSILYSPVAGDIILDSHDLGSFDLFSLVLHELGHSLGLGHNEDLEDAVMYPNYSFTTGLHQDDIDGIQALYGPSVATVPLPAAVWLMLSGLGLISFTSRRGNGKTA